MTPYVVSLKTYNFNIGSGGAAVNGGSNGVNGGNTSISGGALSSTVFAGGGQRGEATGDAPTNGGTASGGDYNIDGGNAAGAGVGEQTSGGPAGGPDATISETNSVSSRFDANSHLVKSVIRTTEPPLLQIPCYAQCCCQSVIISLSVVIILLSCVSRMKYSPLGKLSRCIVIVCPEILFI